MGLQSRLGNIFDDVAIKAPVLVATTGQNIVLSGVQTIDGVAVGNNGERVLVKDQTDPTTNGIYQASTGPWIRSTDGSTNTDFVTGTQVLVALGTVNARIAFATNCPDNPIVLGTSQLTWQALVETVPFVPASYIVYPESFGAVGDGNHDDTSALGSAVAQAVASRKLVYLSGAYKTTASVAGLHSAKYAGIGRILRGSAYFAPNTVTGDSNTIFVATNGNDGNDGLSSSQPMLTIQAAINAISNYGPVLFGAWTVQLAAGTYKNGVLIPENLLTVPDHNGVFPTNRLSIIGPPVGGAPNIPTAIIDGSFSPTTNYGVLLNGGQKLYLQDLLFQNWNGSPSTYGIDITDLAALYTNNVHFYNCSYGLISRQSRVYMNGGIVQGCVQGLTMLNATVFSVGQAAGVTVQNCTVYGIEIGEGSTGHCDGITLNNCVIGAYIVEESHVQMFGTIENNITAGIQLSVNSSYLDAGLTFSGNAVDILRWAHGLEVNSQFNLPAAVCLAQSSSQVAVGPSNTSETVIIPSLGSLPANVFENADRSLSIKLWGTFGSNKNTRTLRLRANGGLSGTLIGTLTFPGDGTTNSSSFDAELNLDAASATAQTFNASLHASYTPYYAAVRNVASGVNAHSSIGLALTAQLADAGDQIIIDKFETWLR